MAALPFSLRVRVYYEDTDAAGVVYHANYLRYFERARTEWLAAAGHSLVELARVDRIVFVVRRLAIDYHAPARLLDRLDVTVEPQAAGRASLEVAQRVRRDDRTLVTAHVSLACVDQEHFKPVRIPFSLTAGAALPRKDPA